MIVNTRSILSRPLLLIVWHVCLSVHSVAYIFVNYLLYRLSFDWYILFSYRFNFIFLYVVLPNMKTVSEWCSMNLRYSAYRWICSSERLHCIESVEYEGEIQTVLITICDFYHLNVCWNFFSRLSKLSKYKSFEAIIIRLWLIGS